MSIKTIIAQVNTKITNWRIIKRCFKCNRFMGISFRDISSDNYICSRCTFVAIVNLQQYITESKSVYQQIESYITRENLKSNTERSSTEEVVVLKQRIAELERDIETSFATKFITANRIWGAPPRE